MNFNLRILGGFGDFFADGLRKTVIIFKEFLNYWIKTLYELHQRGFLVLI
jgi:hypothetical protein